MNLMHYVTTSHVSWRHTGLSQNQWHLKEWYRYIFLILNDFKLKTSESETDVI